MKILLKILLFLFSFQLSAQKYSYTDYYKTVNEAELAFVESDFQKATHRIYADSKISVEVLK